MSRKHLLLLAGAVGITSSTVAPTLAAQGSTMLQVYAARNDALPTNPYLGGIAFTAFTGPLGLRLGGGLNVGQPLGDQSRSGRWFDDNARGTGVSAWTADADFVLAPLQAAWPLKALLLGFSPYGFMGIGGYGARLSGLPSENVATWSYGLGIQHGLLLGLGVSAEAWYRRPLKNDIELPTGFDHDWEYRAGVTVSFGGR
jgi:hypothetical protein